MLAEGIVHDRPRGLVDLGVLSIRRHTDHNGLSRRIAGHQRLPDRVLPWPERLRHLPIDHDGVRRALDIGGIERTAGKDPDPQRREIGGRRRRFEI